MVKPLAAPTIADLQREASDPMTPGERLRELSSHRPGAPWEQPTPETTQAMAVREAALANPSLPLDRLHLALLNAVPAAWQNPAVPLLLLRQPGQELVVAAIEALLRPKRHRAGRETTEETLATLARHVDYQRRRGGPPKKLLARRLAGLFGLPWPEGS